TCVADGADAGLVPDCNARHLAGTNLGAHLSYCEDQIGRAQAQIGLREIPMTMYGTVARMHVKSGHEQQLQAMNDEWAQGRGRQVEGYVASYVLRPDERPDELILV